MRSEWPSGRRSARWFLRRGVIAAVVLSAVSAAAVSPALAQPGSSIAHRTSAGSVKAGHVPAGYRSEFAQVHGFRMHYVRGGHGSPVVLIHGFPLTWSEWRAQMPELAKHHDVIAVDLRGAGASGVPANGYDYATMASDIHALLVRLHVAGGIQIVAHDVGMSISYSYAAQWPREVRRMVVMEAPIPDKSIYKLPALSPDPAKATVWHFGFFQEPFAQTLITGHEYVFTKGFINEFLGVRHAFSASEYRYYTSFLKQPQRLGAWLKVYRQLRTDVAENARFRARGKLHMPILAVGGSKSFGTGVAKQWKQYATTVHSTILVGSGHWVTEEKPKQVTHLVTEFLR